MQTPLSKPAAEQAEWRSHRRLDIAVSVEASFEGIKQIARLTEVSANGARLMLGCLPQIGDLVILRKGSIELSGSVAWTRAGAVGVRFDRPLPESEFVALRRAGLSLPR